MTGKLTATAEGAGFLMHRSALCGANINLAGRPVGKVLTCDVEPAQSRARLNATIPPGETRRLVTQGVLLGLAASPGDVRFTDRPVMKRAPGVGVRRPNANDTSRQAAIARLAHTLQKTVQRVEARQAAKLNYSGRRLNRNSYLPAPIS
jgi:hypothetical protein